MHGRRADLEMALHIGLGGGPAMDARVGIDEGEVLALLIGEAGSRGRMTHAADPAHSLLVAGFDFGCSVKYSVGRVAT